MTWSTDLILVDIAENGQELYIRMAASELGALHKKSNFDIKLQGGKQFLLYKVYTYYLKCSTGPHKTSTCCFSFQLQLNILYNACMSMPLESRPVRMFSTGDKMLRVQNRAEHRR